MQRNRTSIATLALLAIGTLTLTTLTPSLAGPKKGSTKLITVRGKMTRGGTASHIKIAKGTNTRGKEVHKKRAEVASLNVSNSTGWYIDCYVDGAYMGQVGPYGNIYPLVYSGSHQLYAIAHFNDGSSKVWGPTSYFLGSGSVWSLTD